MGNETTKFKTAAEVQEETRRRRVNKPYNPSKAVEQAELERKSRQLLKRLQDEDRIDADFRNRVEATGIRNGPIFKAIQKEKEDRLAQLRSTGEVPPLRSLYLFKSYEKHVHSDSDKCEQGGHEGKLPEKPGSSEEIDRKV